MSTRTRLRLVLPHQLFAQQLDAAADTAFVLIEHDLMFRQYGFHSHKLVLHRASMSRFARRLRGAGYEVEIVRSDATRSSHDQLAELIKVWEPAEVTLYDVVDDWLEKDLIAALAESGYDIGADEFLETPNFLTTRSQVDEWFTENDARMQEFYVWQRRRLDLLVDERGRPVGGKWSFDADNRKKLPRGCTPPIVDRFAHHPVHGHDGTLDLESLSEQPGEKPPRDVRDAIEWVTEEFPNAPGDPLLFAWPTDAAEAGEHLQEFIRERLVDFGPYEDAISLDHPFINHGLLTAALNIGLLDPREVVSAVIDGAPADTPLSSLEGFIRQIAGWREYMRATYRTRGRQLRTSNRLRHRRALGEGWWDASTGLMPVDMVISRVLDTGYAHHIERLMVLGNAMCLLRVDPEVVYEWFMELFIDAYDWVMVPNVYAMSQFAAGTDITTKPYVSGSNYLRKMSDLPRGAWTDDWDALYWTFVEDHREELAANPRARMAVALWDKLDAPIRDAHRERARRILTAEPGARLLRPAN